MSGNARRRNNPAGDADQNAIATADYCRDYLQSSESVMNNDFIRA